MGRDALPLAEGAPPRPAPPLPRSPTTCGARLTRPPHLPTTCPSRGKARQGLGGKQVLQGLDPERRPGPKVPPKLLLAGANGLYRGLSGPAPQRPSCADTP